MTGTKKRQARLSWDQGGQRVVAAAARSNAGFAFSGLTPIASQTPFNAATNQLTSSRYDARGAMTQIGSVSIAYDAEQWLEQYAILCNLLSLRIQ